MKKRMNLKLRKFFKNALCILILIISIYGIFKFHNNTLYRTGTVISGVNCSWLTVEKAEKKINSYLSEQSISFVFPEKIYVIDGKTIDLRLINNNQLREILEKQNNGDNTQNYELADCFTVTSLTNVFSTFDTLKEENMDESKNAYLQLTNSNFLEIVPEKNSYKIDIDEAYQYAYKNLKSGITTIDFSNIIISEPPEICSADLVHEKDEINKTLSTVINYELIDGSIITLDNTVMKDWLIKDENGNYSIDIETNLPNFITSLSEKVNSVAPTALDFNATNFGIVKIPISEKNHISLNTKKELENLHFELLSGKTINRTPIYSKSLSLESYVEIDVSRQKVWMYYNGKCIVETDCVTGTKGKYDTPPGLFYLTYKVEGDYLEGYNEDGSRYKSFVDYWMPFNRGIGLHDAAWRYGKFGGNIYKTNGSHGCINLPFKAAKTIYENIDSSMPIIVYESKKTVQS